MDTLFDITIVYPISDLIELHLSLAKTITKKYLLDMSKLESSSILYCFMIMAQTISNYK